MIIPLVRCWSCDWRRQQGQFRPSYQLCTVPKSASAHADTCSLTHTAVARIQSVHATHCCVLQVWWGCTNREWWRWAAINKAGKKERKEEGVTIKGDSEDTVCTDEHGEWRSGLGGHVEMITNLDLSGTPVSQQRHWSRNIGLHPLATAVLLCFLLFLLLLLFWSQGFKSASAAHFLILPYLYFVFVNSAPWLGAWLCSNKTTDSDLWQMSEGAEWDIDCDYLVWSVAARSFQGQCVHHECICPATLWSTTFLQVRSKRCLY